MTHAEAIAAYVADGGEPTPGFIKTVMIFQNGLCAVFNEAGRQMPEYQGRWDKMESAIQSAVAAHPEYPVTFERLGAPRSPSRSSHADG
jgi:hypothetical protein